MRAISTLAAAAALCTLSLYSFAADPLPDDDWLHVQGNQIVDNHGNPVWLTGANWFGFNTSERVFHGLWAVNLEDRIADLASRGINILRVPISTELIREWQSGMAAVPSINDYVNPELAGKTSLEIFDAVITESKKYGVKILIDVHSAEADNSGHFEPMWYEGNIDSETFYQTWEWLAERYKNDDTVIAFDIENEPHGKPWADSPFAKWDDSTDESNWKYACETAGKRVLAINPNLLVLCEGIESYPKDGVTWASNSSKDFHNYWWGGNLRGATEFPVDLGEHQDQLVYSPHIYGPSVYLQPWFEPDFTPESLMQNAWRDNWFFLYEQGTSPLLLGEWGGHLDDGQNEKWMGYARDLIVEHKLHHTFWCLNPNSGDTGGLWGYDWTTWDEEKYALLKPALWQDSNGKFVSLDHQVALGSSTVGITVSDYYASQTPALNISAPVSNSAFLPGADMLIQFDQRLSSGANIYIDGGQRGTTSQNHATISAPLETGYYQLQLVALNSQGVEISVSDSVNFQVVDEVIAEPAINITSPVAGFGIEVGSQFTLTYTLENAAGARVTLDSNSQFINGNSVDLIAPLIEGNYTVDVVAADENNQLLEASDMIAISVFTPAAAELSCEVGSSDTWSDGFVINTITITNNGENTLNGWQVLLSFSDEASFSSGWGGVFTPSADGHSVSASNLDWNGTLQPGSSTSIGLQGTHSGQFAAPDCVGN